MVDVGPDHPAYLLALLPESPLYSYSDIETASQRPGLRAQVELQLAHFVSRDELPLAEELLLSIGAKGLVVAVSFERFAWTMILSGNFVRVADALRQSAESGMGLSVTVADTYRELDIYSLVRTRSSGRTSEIYLAVLNPGALAASPDPDALREVWDRHQDGGELPRTLAAMVEDWGLSNLFQSVQVHSFGGGVGAEDTPINKARFVAFHANTVDDTTAALRFLQQFEDEEQATQAVAWLNEQPEPHWKNIGWGETTAIDQWRQSGATVYGEAVVPDESLPGLVQGN